MENQEKLYDKMPFYMTYPLQNLYLAEVEYEKDVERMRESYPREVQEILRLVEKRCDELETEGSRMYDENPDRQMMEREVEMIYAQCLSYWKEGPGKMSPPPPPRPGVPPGGAPSGPLCPPGNGMPPPPPRPGRFPLMPPPDLWDLMGFSGEDQEENPVENPMESEGLEAMHHRDCRDDWLCSLIGVLFSNEVYRRRCRNRRCRRWSM